MMARIVDTTGLSGAYAGRLFAEAGHDVIRIEPPGGDELRRMGPALAASPDIEHGAFHEFLNAGKRSMTLNTECAPGRKIFGQLVATADVLLANIPLPIEQEFLLGANSRLVLIRIDDEGSSEICLLARSGVLSLTGQPDGSPMMLGDHSAYGLSGLYAAVAASSGLYHRMMIGRGSVTTVSVRECLEAMLEQAMSEYTVSGKGTERRGSKGGITAVSGAMPCKDGYWTISIGANPDIWKRFMEWVDDPELLHDESLNDEPGRQAKRDFVLERIFAWSRRHNKHELVEKAQELHIPASPVSTTADLKDDPQLIARGYLAEMEHPRYGTGLFPRGAIGTVLGSPPQAAPLLGEHNGDLMAELGYSAEDCQALSSLGAI